MIGGVLLDEHFPDWWPPKILALYPALTIRWVGGPQAPPAGSKDSFLLDWLEANDFVLATNNRKSMRGHLNSHLAKGGHVQGIFNVPKKLRIHVLAEQFELIVFASFPDEFLDQIRDLPL